MKFAKFSKQRKGSLSTASDMANDMANSPSRRIPFLSSENSMQFCSLQRLSLCTKDRYNVFGWHLTICQKNYLNLSSDN